MHFVQWRTLCDIYQPFVRFVWCLLLVVVVFRSGWVCVNYCLFMLICNQFFQYIIVEGISTLNIHD